MSTVAKKYGVLVCVDGSAASDGAVAWATREAALRDLPLTVMYAAEPIGVGSPISLLHKTMPEWQKDHADVVIRQACEAFNASVGEAEPPNMQTQTLYARAVPALIDASKDAWMIVVGSQGKGALGRLLLGSVAAALLHHAHCPVAVIHSDDLTVVNPDGPVLLGIDGSPASEAATALAFDEACRRKAELVALHAWSDAEVPSMLGADWREREGQEQEVLAERLAGWQEQYPDVSVKRMLVCDKPARWLIDESKSAQLVVLGKRGRGGFPGILLGSVSSAVAQSATVPVIVVRGD